MPKLGISHLALAQHECGHSFEKITHFHFFSTNIKLQQDKNNTEAIMKECGLFQQAQKGVRPCTMPMTRVNNLMFTCHEAWILRGNPGFETRVKETFLTRVKRRDTRKIPFCAR